METYLEKLQIVVDAERIAGTLLMHTPKVPGVLFVHGWGGSQEQDLARAREVVGLGCICLTFDLRGHELMQAQRETVTREQNLRDLEAAYDLLTSQHGVDMQSIAVIGASYGGYLAALLTERRPVRWLALRAPALYKDANWDRPKRSLHIDPEFAAYRLSSIRAPDNRALAACARFKGDALIVESEKDEIIPHAVIQNYVAALSGSHSLTARVIAAAGHALAGEKFEAAYTELLITWLTEMISGARKSVAPADDDKSAQGAAY
jgi:pimeloyl-ACP methyl ester carboxylesterase